MSANIKKTATITGKVILRYPAPFGTPLKSVVLDATDSTSWPAPTAADYESGDSRFSVPAGTILAYSATNTDQVIKYAGGSVGDIIGILSSPIDLVANATKSDEGAAAWFTGVVFATEDIVDFTVYTSALLNDLDLCLFQ